MVYPADFVLLSGLTQGADSPADGGIAVAAGVWVQNGQYAVFPGGSVNIVSTNANYYGTGLAANSTYPRIDIVAVSYSTNAINQQSRNFDTGTSPRSVYTQSEDSFTVEVVHGTPASSPVAPAVPAGYLEICQVYVAAGATTIQASNITDETASFRTDGGRLALASGGLFSYVNGTTVNTPTGFKLQVGSNDYLLDNTSTHRLDIQGGSSGVNLLSSTLFSYSGTPLLIQPTADATLGTHIISVKNAAGTEYAWIDNQGNTSFGGTSKTASSWAGVTGFPAYPAGGQFALGAPGPTWSFSLGTSNAGQTAWVERIRIAGNAAQGAGALAFYDPATFSYAVTMASSLLANAGATVASGQTLTLTGATVAGAPTWSSGQTMPSITTTGEVTGNGGIIVGAVGAGFSLTYDSSTASLVISTA